VAVAGCTPDRTPVPSSAASSDAPRPTPAPEFGDIDKANLDQVLAYARGLQFDDEPGHGDRQALAVATRDKGICPEECKYGPVASIAPEIGSVSITDADLKAGRIISRIINEGPGDYKKLNLTGKDTTYVWVFATDSGWRARFVSTNREKEAESRRNRSVQVDGEEHQGRYSRSISRWVWKTQDEGTWGTCGGRCCTAGDEP
jgi:hypothetical protein